MTSTETELIPYLVSFLSYRVVACCLTSVPATHALGLYVHRSPARKSLQQYLLFPFTGGNRHIVFQTLGWVLWAASAAATLPIFMPRLQQRLPLIPHTHVDVVSGAAAACSFIGELFMLKALLVYQSTEKKASDAHRLAPALGAAAVVFMGLLLTVTGGLLLLSSEYLPDMASRVVYTCLATSCALIAASTTHGLAGFLRYGGPPAGAAPEGTDADAGDEGADDDAGCSDAEGFEDDVIAADELTDTANGGSGAACSSSNGAELIGSAVLSSPIASPSPLRRRRGQRGALDSPLGSPSPGGKKRRREGSEGALLPQRRSYRFWQPFVGGKAFIATQALGWTLFAGTIVFLAVIVANLVKGAASCFRCLALGAGCMMFATQLVLGVSLLTFNLDLPSATRRALGALTKRGVRGSLATFGHVAAGALSAFAGRNLPVLLMYLPVHTFCSLVGLSFAFLSPKAATALWLGLMVPYYLMTQQGRPEHSGRRRWPWLCDWISANMESSLTHWFGHVRVVRHGSAPLKPETDKYILGFHPHGLYPTGTGFLCMLPSFRSAMPGLTPAPLAASVLLFLPFIRDVLSWSGFRQVSRATFVRALHEQGSVILCPGGQAELVHTHAAFNAKNRTLVLHTRHKGFCKLAVEHGAHVVPALAIGEMLQLRNVFDWPRWQAIMTRRLGFPFPWMMVGRWGLSPLPRKVPLHYIVGDPIAPPPHTPGTPVCHAAVDALHAKYFESLAEMFHKYKADHPEFADATLVFADD